MNGSCSYCPAQSGMNKSKPISTIGSGPCDLLIAVYEPSFEDITSGVPMTGIKYKYIWDLLGPMGVSYYVTSVVKCRTNRQSATEYCIAEFQAEVARLQPRCILFSGEDALIQGLSGITNTTPVLADYREYAHTTEINGHICKVLATYRLEYATPDKEVTYKRVIEDIVYAGRHAVSYRYDKQYTSKTLTADQFCRVSDILCNDPSIEYVSFDTESNGLDPMTDRAKITSFSFSYDGKVGYNVFLYHPDLDISDSERSSIIDHAKNLFTSKKIIAHHAKHEYRFTKVVWGFTPNITEDTMYMSYILYLAYPGISHGLKYLSGRFLSMPPWEEIIDRYTSMFKAFSRLKNLSEDKVNEWVDRLSDYNLTSDQVYKIWDIVKNPDYYIRGTDTINPDPMYWLVPVDVMEGYAGLDAIAPYKLWQIFKPQIEADPGLSTAYLRMVRCSDAFANIELHGCKFIDPDIWSKRYLEIMNNHLDYLKSTEVVQEYEQEGKEFSPTSPKCMQTILYDKLKFPVLEYTGTGNPSAGEPAMIALIKKMQEEYGEDSDEPRLKFLWSLRDYKKLAKIQGTYFEGLQKLCSPKSYDGVHDRWIDVPYDHSGVNRIMRTQYLLHGTDSGRASSNYHTIPHRSDVAKAISSIYYEHGGVLFQADHSQLELRVLAFLVEKYYGDSSLANAYREGQDIHRFNAGKVFKKDPKDIVDAERRFSKTISFSICYGSSENSVAESTGRTPQEVHELFESFYNSFPGVKAYIEDAHRFATQYGCIRTPMGRVRWIPGSQDPSDRGNYNRAMRQAQNQMIQSAGSDLSLATIAWFNDFARSNDLRSQVMNWVHDSITVDAAPGEWVYAYYCILYGMKHLNEKRDWVCAPLGIDVCISTNWSDEFDISEAHINQDGSWTFTGKGYSYVIEDVLEEAKVNYDILQNDILESEEFVEDVGSGLIAKKSANISYDNKTFTKQKRTITLYPKSDRELQWCLEKYKLEQSGSVAMPGDLSDPNDLY